ncbi:MAG TPA: F0F1 ATP synthase subunit A [Verrucomicrobiae bacterium]|nr:F0F1 ATP synthase subunit A [Verrucomicrobiae bacterium]
MKQFGKIVFACAIFTLLFAVKMNAEPSASTGGVSDSVAAAKAAEPADEVVPAAPPEVFNLLGLPVTNSMICTWIVALIILIIVRATTRKNIKEIPSGMQNILESLVELWDGLIGDILDQRVTRWVFPFATTFFIFIVVSNFMDLIPGVGSIGKTAPDGTFTPYFRPPTTDANLTIAMSAIFLIMSLFWAIRYNGFFGLIKHIFGVKIETSKWIYPLFAALFIFIGFMEVVSIMFARPVSLAMRLYGNIFAGESILDMTFHAHNFALGLLLSICTYFYETFVCLVQAFVFALLVVAFVGTLCMHTDESHDH